MIKRKKMLIVGGTGFIGYHLAKKAIKKNWIVDSLSINKPKKKRKLKRVKYIQADISRKIDLKKKIKNNYSFVINLGGYVNHVNKKKNFKSHFQGSKNLSQILSRKELLTFIQMGSSGEYGNKKSPHKESFKLKIPKNSYAKSKFLATKYLVNLYKKEKFPVTILRLYQAYGPEQDTNRIIPIVINACLKNKKFPCSNGMQLRDFVHIDDLIKCIFLCFNNKKARGNIINIGSGKPVKIKSVINFISKYLKTGFPQFGKIKLRSDEMHTIYPKITKAKNILGWKPKINFYSGLTRTIENFKKNQK